jgi:hypothetical protein
MDNEARAYAIKRSILTQPKKGKYHLSGELFISTGVMNEDNEAIAYNWNGQGPVPFADCIVPKSVVGEIETYETNA